MKYHSTDRSLNPASITRRPGNPAYLTANIPWMSAPSIARSKGGRLFLTFNCGSDDPVSDMLSLSVSDDDGMTWDECIYLVKTPESVRLHEPLVWADPAGRLYVSWIQSYEECDLEGGMWDGRGGLWISPVTDEDGACPVLEPPHRVCNGIMANDPIFDRDGTWLFPVSRWHWDSPFYNDAAMRLSGVYRSVDGGLTADYAGGADVPERTYDENSIVRLSDGRLMMLVRTEYGWGKSYSSDDGRTWTAGVPFRKGPSAKSLLKALPDGRLLWVGYDTTRPVRERIAVFLSGDDGETWPFRLLLDGRENVSYPNAHVTSDGTVYVAHDYDRTGAKESVIHKFTAEDIVAGKLVSTGSFLGRVAFR